MPAFDLGLINGDAWGATQVDAVELGITDRGIEVATTSQRNTITGARLFNGKHVYDTTLDEPVFYKTVDTTWHGVRSHWFLATGSATSSAANTAITLYSGTLPTYGVGGLWMVRYMVFLGRTGTATTVAGQTAITMTLAGVSTAASLFSTNIIDATNGYTTMVSGSASVAAGGATVSVSLTRTSASPSDATITTVNDSRYNRVEAHWIPL